MCTTLLRIDPDAEWPLLLAFVRDEERDRETLPPGFWWPDHPTLFGARDARAGGTWLAIDARTPHPAVAFVQNQIGPHVTPPDVAAAPSRGTLPLTALAVGAEFDAARLPQLDSYQPFHLVRTCPLDGEADWWQWNGNRLEPDTLRPGLHVIGSRGPGLPGELDRRAMLRQRFSAVPAPTPDPLLPVAAAWGDWIALLDGRHVAADDHGDLVVHSVVERPGFGTVGATLVAVAADGRIRFDVNSTSTLDPDAWTAVPVGALAGARR